MATIICDYCKDTFIGAKNQKYCPGKHCARRMGSIKKKLKQKEYHNTLEPRICNRCATLFQFEGMKKHCKECVEHLKEKPQDYRPQSKGHKVAREICERCKRYPKWSSEPRTKYCMKCKKAAQKEMLKKKNDEEKLKRKNSPKVITKTGDIDPFYLRRGKPSRNGSGPTQFDQ